ncbi:MAG: histidine phosphatase family protein [Armatimonadota bacterium]
MKRIILVRHGQADHALRGLMGGWTDSSLTDLGREQARVTGEHLATLLGESDFGVYSSDLRRAQQSAEIIGECVGLAPIYDEDLREFNNGEAANLSVNAAQKIQLPPTRPLVQYRPYPGAENWWEMTRRVSASLEEIARRERETAVVITHTLSATSVVHWWLRLGEEYWDRVSYDFDPSSLTLLTVNMFGERTITRLNDTRHLAAAGLEADDEALPGVRA